MVTKPTRSWCQAYGTPDTRGLARDFGVGVHMPIRPKQHGPALLPRLAGRLSHHPATGDHPSAAEGLGNERYSPVTASTTAPTVDPDGSDLPGRCFGVTFAPWL